MKCPYCASEMKPCGSVSYAGRHGAMVAEWVRCEGCQHATVSRRRPMFSHSAAPRDRLASLCLAV